MKQLAQTLLTLLPLTALFCSSLAMAQGDEEFTEQDASSIERSQSFTKRGPRYFATAVQGETYSELPGSIGHTATDLSIAGNGLLSYSVRRKFEEIPQQYPYAMGTMSLQTPHLLMELAPRIDFDSEQSILSCGEWVNAGARVYNTIKFVHEGGVVEFVPRSVVNKSAVLDNFPANALYVSKSNWYLQCTNNPDELSKFRIHAPSGTVYIANPEYGERYRTSKNQSGTPKEHFTYKIYIEEKWRHNSTLTYFYEQSPEFPEDGDNSYVVQPPLFTRYRANSASSAFSDNTIFNKRRLQRVELVASHETSVLESDAEKQTVFFAYRDIDATSCPGRLDRVYSSTSRVKEVRYQYTELDTNNNGNVCLLDAVSNVFHDSDQSEQIWRFAYRYRDGQAFLGGAGGSNNPTYWYLPLKSVETPTATKVTYDYDVMGICHYQSVNDKVSEEECNFEGTNGETTFERSGPRRPIVIKRSVADKYDDTAPVQITEFAYENSFNFTYTILRTITDENVSHKLSFGRPDHYETPAGVTYASIEEYIPVEQGRRFERSGRLYAYELSVADSDEPFVQVEHIYRETQSFFENNLLEKWVKTDSYSTGNYNYLYTQRRINPYRTLIRKEGHVYEKLYTEYDSYNNLKRLQENTRLNGVSADDPSVLRRTTFSEYNSKTNVKCTDESALEGTFWFVGALCKTSINSGERYPLVNTYKYNDLGRVVETVKAGFKTNMQYHRMGNVSKVINSDGSTTEFKNYKRGVAQTTTNANGETTVNYTDNFGNVFTTQDGRNNQISYEYSDRYLRKTKTIFNEGVSDSIIVHPVWINRASSNYRTKREIQGNYLKTTTYDHQQRVVRVEVEDVADPQGARIITYKYDVTGRLIEKSDPHLEAEAIAAEEAGESLPHTKYVYDAFGRIKISAHTSDGAPLQYCYGPACNSDSLFSKSVNEPVVDGYAIRDKSGFVSVHNFVSYGAPDYSWATQISQEINDAEAVVTDITRNLVGFIKQVTQRSSADDEVTKTRTYTPYEATEAETTTLLLKSEQHPEFSGPRTVTSFDAVGNPKTVTDFDGSEIAYNYDPAYRLLAVLYQNDVSNPDHNTNNVEYTYYPNGQLESVRHGGSSWFYDYDKNNQLVSESLSIDSLPETFDIAYSYDNLMHLDSVTYPSQKVVGYDHNAFGETIGVSGYVASASYHPTGQLKEARYENGQVFTTTVDDKQRPHKWQLSGYGDDQELAFNMAYLYDVRDNVSEIGGYFNSGASSSLTNLGYDGLSRLKQADGEWFEGTTSLVSYSYNALGDITSKTLDGSFAYVYDPTKGTLSSVLAPASAPLGNRSFAYDGRGNVTGNGQDTFKYNQLNQLIEVEVVESPGSTGFKYIYDGNAMRVKTITTEYDDLVEGTVDTGATYHLYTVAGQLLHEHELGSGETRDHIFFNGKRIATRLTHNRFDTDADGMPDYYERLHGLNPTNASDAMADADMDTLSNLFEYQNNLIPSNSDSDFDGIPDQDDPDTPTPPVEQGTIAMQNGLEISPEGSVTAEEEMTVSFALVETEGVAVSVNALELWIQSSDGSDFVKIQSPDLPTGEYSMEAEDFQEFTVDINIADYELSIGDYFIELRMVDAAGQSYLPESLGGAVNPVAFMVENAPEPPPVPNNVTIEPIISFFLD